MRKLIFCISILLLMTVSIIRAQRGMQPSSGGDNSVPDMPEFNTYALMVAVNDYDHHDDLTNPVPDMEAIEKELREVYGCKTNILRNPTHDEFLSALYALADRKYKPNDQLMVFFSGHGWYDERIKRGYLALKDSKAMEDDPLYNTYVSHEDVRAVLERLDCSHVLLIVDSCFSGTLDPTIATANMGKGTDMYASVPRPEYIQRKLRYKTRRYITSGGKEYVPDGRPGQHSPFARRVLESLRTFGGNDGILTLEEMMIEVEKATPEPRIGEMLENEPGSSFVLVACTTMDPLPDEITGKDGAAMVLIPAGEFQMGSNDGEDDEKPVHTVYLDAFYMDKYEVTNTLYREFMDATGYRKYVDSSGYTTTEGEWMNDSKYNAPNHPVVHVTWNDAAAYAEWAGKRLPTEAEWEKAARGGLSGKKYPWGDEEPDAGGVHRANHGYSGSYAGYYAADGYKYAAPVGSYTPNYYGLYDMSGNAMEWCSDWYAEDYYASSPRRNPTGPDSGTNRVIRGGSYGFGPPFLRVTARWQADQNNTVYSYGGFRCIQNAAP